GLQRRDQRVATEDRHEPGHAGGGELADAVEAPDPERGEVGEGAVIAVAEIVVVRRETWDAELERLQRRAHVLQLGAERRDGARVVAVGREADLDRQLPATVLRKDEVVAGAPRSRLE